MRSAQTSGSLYDRGRQINYYVVQDECTHARFTSYFNAPRQTEIYYYEMHSETNTCEKWVLVEKQKHLSQECPLCYLFQSAQKDQNLLL